MAEQLTPSQIKNQVVDTLPHKFRQHLIQYYEDHLGRPPSPARPNNITTAARLTPLDPSAEPIILPPRVAPAGTVEPATPPDTSTSTAPTRDLEADRKARLIETTRRELRALDPNQIADPVAVISQVDLLDQEKALDPQTEAHLLAVGGNPAIYRTWHDKAFEAGKRADLLAVNHYIALGQRFGLKDNPKTANFYSYLEKYVADSSKQTPTSSPAPAETGTKEALPPVSSEERTKLYGEGEPFDIFTSGKVGDILIDPSGKVYRIVEKEGGTVTLEDVEKGDQMPAIRFRTYYHKLKPEVARPPEESELNTTISQLRESYTQKEGETAEQKAERESKIPILIDKLNKLLGLEDSEETKTAQQEFSNAATRFSAILNFIGTSANRELAIKLFEHTPGEYQKAFREYVQPADEFDRATDKDIKSSARERINETWSQLVRMLQQISWHDASRVRELFNDYRYNPSLRNLVLSPNSPSEDQLHQALVETDLAHANYYRYGAHYNQRILNFLNGAAEDGGFAFESVNDQVRATQDPDKISGIKKGEWMDLARRIARQKGISVDEITPEDIERLRDIFDALDPSVRITPASPGLAVGAPTRRLGEPGSPPLAGSPPPDTSESTPAVEPKEVEVGIGDLFELGYAALGPDGLSTPDIRENLSKACQHLSPSQVQTYLFKNPFAVWKIKDTNLLLSGRSEEARDRLIEIIKAAQTAPTPASIRDHFSKDPLDILTLASSTFNNEFRDTLNELANELSPDLVRLRLEENPFFVLRINFNLATPTLRSPIPPQTREVIQGVARALQPEQFRIYLQNHPLEIFRIDRSLIGKRSFSKDVEKVFREESERLMFKFVPETV